MRGLSTRRGCNSHWARIAACSLWLLLSAAKCNTDTSTNGRRRVVVGAASPTPYIAQSIAVLQYGHAPTQIGLLDEPGIGPSGPQSFWVDSAGHIFVCDSVNKKVKELSRSGELLHAKDIGFSGNDIAVDDNREIFILDRSRRLIEHIDTSGRRQSRMKLVKRHIDTAFNLRFTDGEVVLSSVMQDEIVLGQTRQGRSVLVDASSAKQSRAGLRGRAGRSFQTLRNHNRQGQIDVIDERGRIIDKLLLPVDDVASIVPLGQDREGNSYFQLETSVEGKGVALSVYCLDPDGNLDSIVDNIPNDYYVWTAKLLQVDEKGDIYQVLPTKDEVKINVWRRQRPE